MKENLYSCKRDSTIDVVKGIGIILVILGHTFELPEIIHDMIYSFHMPLFFVVSGFLYNEEKYSTYTLKATVLKSAKDYLIPYYVFAFINLFLVIVWSFVILHSPISLTQIGHYVIGIILCLSDMLHMPNCTPIWFLMSLFFTRILFGLFIKNLPKHSIWIALISIGIGLFFSFLFVDRVPLKLDTIFMAMFFMYVGYWFRKLNLLHYPLIISIIGIFGVLLGSFNKVGMNENEYGNVFIFLFSSISVSYSLMLVCKKTIISKVKILSLLGKHSLIIVGFNYFLRDFAVEIYYLVPIVKNIRITWFPSFMVTLVFAIITVWLWDRFKKCIVPNKSTI
jgi:fucose 4-O-acetylase-like acetyltransferase